MSLLKCNNTIHLQTWWNQKQKSKTFPLSWDLSINARKYQSCELRKSEQKEQ